VRSPPPARDEQATATVLGLLRGTSFIKHGRRGWPHARVLWLDVTQAELGLRWGKGFGDAAAPWLSLGAVLAVARGRATPVLERSAPAARAAACFAIMCMDRTLDFEAPNADAADLWATGLERLFAEPTLLQRTLMDIVRDGLWTPPQE
jgi:hypothetical protein